jgi:hypothetical protein
MWFAYLLCWLSSLASACLFASLKGFRRKRKRKRMAVTSLNTSSTVVKKCFESKC